MRAAIILSAIIIWACAGAPGFAGASRVEADRDEDSIIDEEDAEVQARLERRRREDPVGYCRSRAADDYRSCRKQATEKAEAALAEAKRRAALANALNRRRLVPVQAETDGVAEVARMELETCESDYRFEIAECGGRPNEEAQ